MKRNIFLHVYGGDYTAMNFEDNYDIQTVYEEMSAEGVTNKVFTIEDEEDIYVDILEFGEIDPAFISFIKSQLCDYDQLKSEDIFEVELA